MARVAVIGGGMAGLAVALFSARRGHEATIVDRDPGPPSGSSDDLAAWDRRGVPHAGFSHYFLARSTRVIRQEAPELLDVLAAAGIGPSSVTFGSGYEHDVALLSRRPVYEAVFRGFVAAQPGIRLVQGSATALLAHRDQPERIRGVRLRDGQELESDLVVDAAGRRSASGRWLRDLGLQPPEIADEPCEAHYYCQHFRLRDGQEFPSTAVPTVQPLPYATVLIFIGDDRTFSVASSLSEHDPHVRRLQDPEVFQRFLMSMPLTAGWLERAEPIGELRVMAGLANRRRRLVVDGRPAATGIAVVGDACQYTNPALGQGISLSFWMAQRLAADVERVDDDPAGTALAYEAWVDDELGPRFERQLRTDRALNRQRAAGLAGHGFLPPEDERARYLQALVNLAGHDEAIAELVVRVGHLLDPPSRYDEPPVRRAVERLLDTGPPAAPPIALSRQDFERLVTA